MNKYAQIPDKIFDLHGYTIREAEPVLSELCKQNKIHARIIVGKGKHSVNGPVLREFVKDFLQRKNVRFTQSKIQDGGEGSLEAFL